MLSISCTVNVCTISISVLDIQYQPTHRSSMVFFSYIFKMADLSIVVLIGCINDTLGQAPSLNNYGVYFGDCLHMILLFQEDLHSSV